MKNIVVTVEFTLADTVDSKLPFTKDDFCKCCLQTLTQEDCRKYITDIKVNMKSYNEVKFKED